MIKAVKIEKNEIFDLRLAILSYNICLFFLQAFIINKTSINPNYTTIFEYNRQ